MKLYFVPASPPSRSVLMTIRCLELDVEVITVDMQKGETKSPEFLKLNPLGKVPVLVDGDFVLSESRAIMTYLVNAKNLGHSMYPNDPKKRAIIDSRLYFDAAEVFNLIYMSVRPIFQEGKKDIPEDIRSKFKTALGHLESFLNDNQYFAGDEPSLADISILSNIVLIKSLFGNIGNLPNLEAWFKRCSTLPGYEENLKGGKTIDEVFGKMGIEIVPLE